MIETSQDHPGQAIADAVAAVQAYLSDSPCLPGTQIRCEAAGNRIVLCGYVSTYSMKHTARVLAESVSGNRPIEVRLDVIPFPVRWEP